MASIVPTAPSRVERGVPPVLLAFHVHAVTTGTVLGLRPAGSPDRGPAEAGG
ncbi:hypothetical protein [Streptomyces sp. NPDC014623]|uniref:hypothetical protein n=1 Tax=Streptomyces sp. NPDC014623 TaxID=3364875 RepID=UPI0036F5A98B